MKIVYTALIGIAATACLDSQLAKRDQNKDAQTPEAKVVMDPEGLADEGNEESPEQPVRGPVGGTSYLPIAISEDFDSMRNRLAAEKPEVMARQMALLEFRYDLGDYPHPEVTMTRGKPVQTGVRARLKAGQSWAAFNQLTPAQIKEQELFPEGFLPLPHAKQEEGGQVLPQFQIDEIQLQEARDLLRFDVEFDLPEHIVPEFPPPIFLTTRPDLGDVTQGKLITSKNFFEIFDGILTPRQMDGLRLLVSPFAQQQFNLTSDRRVETPQLGIACFDCHANGHTNAAFHLDPVTRPQEARRRIDTPTLRGVNVQRLFGSQRAIKTVEDFTEFEQLGAYFDGDHVIAAKKGFNKLDRAIQVAHMAEFQSILDFPPAPKLGGDGKLIPELATEAELRGQDVFFGKGRCAECHAPPHYTDNTMHNLKAERFYKAKIINGRFTGNDGPIKTFPLRGIKDTPPYLHDGRLLTLDDTVEFFNIVLELKLNEQEKKDLVTFMYAL